MTYALVDDISVPGNDNRAVLRAREAVARATRQHPKRKSGIYAKAGKRLFDIAILALALPFTLPVLAIVWLVTVLDGGHGFYAQERVGRNGRIFKCWKIRTMVPNAESVLQKLIRQDKAIAREWATNQKLTNDPRITRWGRVLRQTSLDELPQLWNVLTGDMSLIGPRPFTPDQRALYDQIDENAEYYGLRPGISGLWQVDCRNDGEFFRRVEFDNTYGRELSFAQDLRITLKTFSVILKGTGR